MNFQLLRHQSTVKRFINPLDCFPLGLAIPALQAQSLRSRSMNRISWLTYKTELARNLALLNKVTNIEKGFRFGGPRQNVAIWHSFCDTTVQSHLILVRESLRVSLVPPIPPRSSFSPIPVTRPSQLPLRLMVSPPIDLALKTVPKPHQPRCP